MCGGMLANTPLHVLSLTSPTRFYKRRERSGELRTQVSCGKIQQCDCTALYSVMGHSLYTQFPRPVPSFAKVGLVRLSMNSSHSDPPKSPAIQRKAPQEADQATATSSSPGRPRPPPPPMPSPTATSPSTTTTTSPKPTTYTSTTFKTTSAPPKKRE